MSPNLAPPEPLTAHEQNLVLVKSRPPQPAALYYLVALLTGIGGIVMGWIYLVKDGSSNKGFGIKTLLIGFILPLVIAGFILAGQAIEKNTQAPLPEQPGVLLPE